MGTGTGGLNRFDPVAGHFKAWRNDPRNPSGLSYDAVRVIRTDRAGRLWLGTLRGLDRFDPGTERFTVHLHDKRDPASLSNEVINSMYRDHQGTLWIGTRRGLNRLDQTRVWLRPVISSAARRVKVNSSRRCGSRPFRIK